MAKARTKSQKLAAKRGRPTLPVTDREPNGRASRRHAATQARNYAIEDNNMDAAVQTRIRQFNLKDYRDRGGNIVTAREQAIDPRRGYVLGCMLLDKAVTKDQHDAGLRFAEEMSRYYGLTGVPFPSVRAQDLFAVRSDNTETSHGRAMQAASARHVAHKLRDALLAVRDIETGRRILHSVTQVCLLDIEESRRWPAHMTSYLTMGLNALCKHYQGN